MKKIIWIIVIIAIGAGVLAYGMFRTPANTEDTSQQQDVSEGKLNIIAICEGALAYMTFPDGESAEKFVAECKEGKHPEVIEKYKADLNLGDGAAI